LIVAAVAEPVEGHVASFVYYGHGFNEQIFGADEQVYGCGLSDKRTFVICFAWTGFGSR